jgi:hypothetical protein
LPRSVTGIELGVLTPGPRKTREIRAPTERRRYNAWPEKNVIGDDATWI